MPYSYQVVRERSRDRSPEPFFSRPLIRRSTKRHIDLSDDGHDDYPYSSSHKPSTSLVVRKPMHLEVRKPMSIEKYNVWSEPSSHSSSPRHHHYHSSSDDDDRYDARFKYTRKEYIDDEPTSKYKYEARYHERRPSSSHSDRPAMFWPGSLLTGKSKDKWEQVDWMNEKKTTRKNDFWSDDDETLETTKYRKMKRSRTNEWKPLASFRRR